MDRFWSRSRTPGLSSSPSTPGRLWGRLVPAGLLGLTLLWGCGGEGNPGGTPGNAARAEAGQGQGPGGRRELPPVPVSIRAAARGPIASYYSATATLEANKEAEILARVSGVVLSIPGEEGDRVRKGQEILLIEDAEYRYRLKQAEAGAAQQQARFERNQRMFEGNLLSAEEFDVAKTDLQSAEAALELAQLELSYTRVVSPFEGRIVTRHVDPGETVSDGTPLFTIADLSRLLARVHVPSKEFRRIEPDQTVELTLDSSQTRLEGRIDLVSPVIDPTTGTIKVTVEIPRYPEDTRPGDFAEVRIVTARHENALLVPRTAVISDKGELVVFVASADSTAERRVVEVGFEDEDHAEILGGVDEGENVVIQGQRSLKHGSPLRIMEPISFRDEDEREDS